MHQRSWRERTLVPVVTCLLGAALGVSSVSGDSPKDLSPYRNLSIFARALSHLELSYVDPIDQDALINGAIEGMAAALDPHTAYLPAERYQRLMEDTEGQYGGIGVEIMGRDGWLTVTNVFPKSPAAKAQLKPGDRVLSIDRVPARDMRMADALDRVRGPIGTTVELGILRIEDEKRSQLVKRLLRQAIEVDPVSYETHHGLAIIRVAAFTEHTAAQLQQHVQIAMANPEAKAIVLDLRGNAGGLLDQAARSADLFLNDGTIVSTRGRGGAVLANYKADGTAFALHRPLFIWVDAFTASAAEILAAALQDARIAVLIGHRTWGKGSVQNIVELPDGSALKVTVARYFTGRGRSIQAAGVTPDITLYAPPELPSERSLQRHLSSGQDLQAKPPHANAAWWNDRRLKQARAARPQCNKKGTDHQVCTSLIVDALQPEDS